jgi:hypothetical protein
MAFIACVSTYAHISVQTQKYTVSYSNTDIIIQATYDKLKMNEKKDNFRKAIPFFRTEKNLCPAASL